jgi:hypothetical protein
MTTPPPLIVAIHLVGSWITTLIGHQPRRAIGEGHVKVVMCMAACPYLYRISQKMEQVGTKAARIWTTLVFGVTSSLDTGGVVSQDHNGFSSLLGTLDLLFRPNEVLGVPCIRELCSHALH